jgi:hypothetical protein
MQLRERTLLPFRRPHDGLRRRDRSLKLKFDCSRRKPQITITLLEVHPEHLPKRLMIHKPMKVDGKIVWHKVSGMICCGVDIPEADRRENDFERVLPSCAVQSSPSAESGETPQPVRPKRASDG